jgi:hypothetical protein
MTLAIPDIHRRVLTAVASLSDNEIEAIASTLKRMEPTFDLRLVGGELASASGLSLEQSTSLVEFLVALSGLVASGITASELATDIINSVGQQEGLSADWEVLHRRIPQLLSPNRFLATSAKAFDLMGERENIFRGTRIVTDLRPIFEIDAIEKPRLFALMHTLFIECIDGEGSRSFYFALDPNDLLELKRVIDRALAKERALHEMAQDKKLTLLGLAAE